jgi:uncharacterized protein YjbJ (UPF0337 family)
MNWDQIEGKWKQFTGSARERWGKLTDDDWQTIAGKKDQLIGRISGTLRYREGGRRNSGRRVVSRFEAVGKRQTSGRPSVVAVMRIKYKVPKRESI